MSEEEKLIRLEELRQKLTGVPLKAILAGILLFFMVSNFDIEYSLLEKIMVFAVIYSFLSFIYYCVKMMGNWILGILMLILILVGTVFMEEAGGKWELVAKIFYMVLVFGGFMRDIVRVLCFAWIYFKKTTDTNSIE